MDLARGVRRVEIVYRDGVEVELRIPHPAGPEVLAETVNEVPRNAHLIGSYTDTEDDGRVYTYSSFWIPAQVGCGACKCASGVTGSHCKLVAV
ncbi:hypothetical protein [Nonomuraea roseola]|uniref:Uncharacterized protein n=1 Tax=Nonomuraea roseola TaxID=46179 RepID=A0ABV5Q0R3_9ACTN